MRRQTTVKVGELNGQPLTVVIEHVFPLSDAWLAKNHASILDPEAVAA